MAVIRNLIALALLALVLAPLVSLHQLGAIEAGKSGRILKMGSVGAVTFDSLIAATRL
jgi:hypothetical protein